MKKRALMVGVDRYEDGAFWYWVAAAAALAAVGGIAANAFLNPGGAGMPTWHVPFVSAGLGLMLMPGILSVWQEDVRRRSAGTAADGGRAVHGLTQGGTGGQGVGQASGEAGKAQP